MVQLCMHVEDKECQHQAARDENWENNERKTTLPRYKRWTTTLHASVR